MNYFEQDTERLKLRMLTKDDIPVWTTFFENNDHLKYLGIDLSLSGENHAAAWIEKQLGRYQIEGLGHLAVELKATNEFIGVAGILPRTVDDRNELEIAYSLIPKYWQKGYGTELAKQMRHFGSLYLDAERLVSIIDKRNKASIRVAIKNGMELLYETYYLGMDVAVYGVYCDDKSQ